MTNNPTIDGVSRDSILRLVEFLGDAKAYHKVVIKRCNASVKSGESSERDEYGRIGYRTEKIEQVGRLSEELRALLDAPAVERQEPYGFASVLIDNFQFSIDNGKPLTFSKGDLLWFIEQLSKAQSESAALQSTIAQLEDKLNKAIDLDFQRRETIEQLQARVQELESGKVSTLADGIQTLERIGASIDARQQRIDALTAPPAPVAVVLPERIGYTWPGSADIGWNACLDATAALNTIHVGELDPAQRLALARGDSFIADISGDWGTGWTFIDANKTGEGQGVCYAFPPGLTITGKWV